MNSSLFKRMSWNEYENNKIDLIDQQIIYIIDKDIFVHQKKINSDKFINLLYSGSYGFGTQISLSDLKRIENQLVSGLYVTDSSDNGNRQTIIYYFDGKGEWIPIASSSSIISIVRSVNNKGPDSRGNVIVAAENINAAIKNEQITVQKWLSNLQQDTVKINKKHQWYNNKGPNGEQTDYTDYNEGNIQVSGYVEGKMDGGGW